MCWEFLTKHCQIVKAGEHRIRIFISPTGKEIFEVVLKEVL